MRKTLLTIVLALCVAAPVAPGASAARTVALTGPATAATDTATTLKVKTARSFAGERVVLKKRTGGEWQRVARKELGRRGGAVFHRTHDAGGTHLYRAQVHGLRSNRLAIVVQAPVVIEGPPPADAPPPAATTPPPAASTPPPIVPPLPELPPYPGAGTGGGITFSQSRTTSLVGDNLDCGTQGYVGTRHLSGVGNGYEWEVWVPTLWYYDYANGWTPLSVGSYHYRDSAPHPFSTSGHAWLTYPSGATNAYAQWYWPVSRGWWYAVGNYDYSASHGWSVIWGHQFADTSYPQYCYAN
jgi:hypothetical protein